MSCFASIYPASPEIYARRYSLCTVNRQQGVVRKQELEVENALHALGRHVMGEPENPCLDVAIVPLRPLSTKSWIVQKLREGAVRYRPRNLLAVDPLAAVLGAFHPACEQFAGPVRKEHLVFYWEQNTYHDPRLTYAEGLFAAHRDGIDGSHPTAKAPLLAESFRYLAQPRQAMNLAEVFLYSRLVQHAGEGAQGVVDPLAHALSVKLDEVRDHPVSIRADHFVSLLKLFAPSLADDKALQECAPDLVKDHERLLNGSWARDRLAEVMAAKAPRLCPR